MNIESHLSKLLVKINQNGRNTKFLNEKGVKVYIPYGKKHPAWFTKTNNKKLYHHTC